MPKQEEFDVDERYGEQYKGHYVARQLPWALRKEIIEKYTQYNHQTGQVLTINHTAIQAEFVMASLKQPGKGPGNGTPITLEKLLSRDIDSCVPPELAELIEKKVNSVINLLVEERKNS
jgi:hypothetical protein